LNRALAALTSEDHFAAVDTFHRILRKWPATSSAKRAREHLTKLRANEPLRTWTSSDGRFSLIARFVREDGKYVVLETEEGKTIRIEQGKLSINDRQYVIMRRKRI
jgi:hypothetical protein